MSSQKKRNEKSYPASLDIAHLTRTRIAKVPCRFIPELANRLAAARICTMSNRGGLAGGQRSSALPRMFQFKLVLLGESAVGKSSLVLRFVKDVFQEYQESTIGAAFLTQTVVIDDSTIKFEIWDTAGQERYHSLAPMYYRGAQAAVVVYDITNMESFVRAKQWTLEIQRQASPHIVIALAGNKADLGDQRRVPYDDGAAFSEQNGLLFLETSAKSAMNVNDLFVAIAKRMTRTLELGVRPNASPNGDADTRRLRETPNGGESRRGCCSK